MRMFGVGFVAFTVLVIGGKIYMATTRPAAPLPVARTLDTFAPGLQLGEPVSAFRTKLGSLRFVSHLGFVGANVQAKQAAEYFPQVRLLLSTKWRVKKAQDAEKAPVEALELVTARPYMSGYLSQTIAETFRTAPHVGCVRTSTPGVFREVAYWTTKNDLGGAAVVYDWKADATYDNQGQVVTSLIVYTGRFDGARTLRADFFGSNCATLAGAS
jgi:hypothetical protein